MGSPARTARLELLREVLDVTIAVGRRVESEGRGEVPAPLRPVLSLARVGSRARTAADRAGDDDEFRSLVAEAVSVDELDDAGRLWLTRPPGWEDQLDELVQRRIDATAGADTYRTLDRERRARRRAEADRDRLQADRDKLRTEVARLKSRSGETTARARRLADEHAEAVRALEELTAAHAAVERELGEAKEALAAAERALAERRPEPEPGPDRAAVAAAVEAAAGVAAELARTLDALAADVRPPEPAPVRREEVTEVEAPLRPRRPARRRRQRPPLPGGIHDDSPEAAAHLVRVPGCHLLVDGYNATMATWPGRDLPEQRRRLVDGLDQLEARTGARVTAVFDGVSDAWRRSASRRVDVRFTESGVEADDVILDLIDGLPEEVPVVVASDDQRVRTGARARGAHAIGTAQLQTLLV